MESQLGGPPRGPGPHGVLTGSESCTPGHTRPHYTAANDCHHCAVVLESKNALSYSWHKTAPTPNYSSLPHTVLGSGCCMCCWNTHDIIDFCGTVTPMNYTGLPFHSFNYTLSYFLVSFYDMITLVAGLSLFLLRGP